MSQPYQPLPPLPPGYEPVLDHDGNWTGGVAHIATGEAVSISLLCEVCGSEGRVLRQHVTKPYEEVDHGECPECKGAGVVEVEAQPVEMGDGLCPECGTMYCKHTSGRT
jgi:hypothetical protein